MTLLVRMLQGAAHAVGLHLQQRPGGRLRWSDRVDHYYPVDLKPRWGHGRPPHERMAHLLGERRHAYAETLRAFEATRAMWGDIPMDRGAAGTPYWTNGWFNPMDAAVLMGMLATRAPARYLEIGSGNSTLFARHAVRSAALATTLTSIDPEPRAEVDAICDEVIRVPLESCAMAPFDALRAGDILMLDSSHRALQNSDVTAFFMDILPRLAAGVIVHVHDIFWPSDYPADWADRLYSEQYVLGAMLLARQPPFRVLMPNRYVSLDPELAALKPSLFRADLVADARFHLAGGVSFWMEIV